MKLRRSAPPIVLSLLGLTLLIGCIPIPGTYRRMRGDGTRPEAHIGDERSNKPLKFMHATIADVVRVLGEPNDRTLDGKSLIYAYRVNDATTIYPLCFMVYPASSPRYLKLDFDGSDTLLRYKIYTYPEAQSAGLPTPRTKDRPHGFFEPAYEEEE